MEIELVTSLAEVMGKKMKGKVFLPLIAMMIFLSASTCIAKEVKAEELYTIAEGMLGYDVTYAIKMPREYKLGEDMPIVFEFRADKDISYFHFYGVISGMDFDKKYTDIKGETILTETFKIKLTTYETELIIEFKYEYPGTLLDQPGISRVAGWHRIEIDVRQFAYYTLISDYESKMSTLESKINELNNELNDLKTINTQLSSQLGDLQKRYDSLERDYKGLERDYDTLKKEYESLQKVPLPFVTTGLQWLTPVLIVTTVILVITTIYFATRKRQSPIK